MLENKLLRITRSFGPLNRRAGTIPLWEDEEREMIRTGISPFDCVAGGLPTSASHLLYGATGTGKSTFGLQFLHWGLSQGERALLATRRTGRDVLQHSEAIGLALHPYVQSGTLLLLEFSPDVVERAARVKDFSQIVDEMQYFVGGRKLDRIVFDPLTPLIQGMNMSESAFRVRSFLQQFDRSNAVILFLLDLPEAASLAEISKDAAAAVLRFEAESDLQRRMLVIERLPGASNGSRRIAFTVGPGKGITEAGPEGSDAAAQRRVLVASKDSEVVAQCRQVLGEEYELTECDGPLQAMAQMAAKPFDLLLMDADCDSQQAVQACLELRRNQLNLPILAVGDGYKRLRDRLTLLAHGLDECLQKPVDGRLLRIRVRALLKRYSSRERYQDQRPDVALIENLSRPAPPSQLLNDIAGLRRALEEEQTNARRRFVPLSVCWMEMENNEANLVSLVEVIRRLVRPHDLVYQNGRGVAVVLPETSVQGASAFFRRVQAAYPSQTLEKACIVSDDSPDFADRVITLASALKSSERAESRKYSAVD